VLFGKGQRKDDVMTERMRQFQREEGIVFLGKAQEKAAVFRTGGCQISCVSGSRETLYLVEGVHGHGTIDQGRGY
jgi:hypothetical protein